ncbi:MAG: hypothetical protein CM15mP87_04100 [Candidatus Neomarinimicrobiota bacterium]|nr:MAG: hypothetical protein CM15mP87_04100 [Candidatus Neomarinimicrobiota bacterium]
MIKKNQIQTYLDQQSKLFGKELFLQSSKQYDKNLTLSKKIRTYLMKSPNFINQYHSVKNVLLGTLGINSFLELVIRMQI